MTLADTINRMIEKAMLSAYIDSPRFDDYKIRVVEEVEIPNLEGEIREALEADPSFDPKIPKQTKIDEEIRQTIYDKLREKDFKFDMKSLEAEVKKIVQAEVKSITASKSKREKKKELDDYANEYLTKKFKKELHGQILERFEKFDKPGTNFAVLNQIPTDQLNNVLDLAKDPTGFVIGTFGKFVAKGAGVAALATLLFSAVTHILNTLMQPGRAFDRQFKRDVREEILNFTDSKRQKELRQGFRSVIITSLPFIRHAEIAGQVSGNLYNPTVLANSFVAPQLQSNNSPRAFGTRGSQKFTGRNP